MLEAITEVGEIVGAWCGEPLGCELGGAAEADERGDVLSPGAALALLRAAEVQGRERGLATDVEDAGAFRAVELVAGDREQIAAEVVDGEGKFARGLDGVGMEERAGGVGESGELAYRLNDAGLVICRHDADQTSLRGERCFEGGGIDAAGGGAGEDGDVDGAAFCECFGGSQDGVVLDGGRDEVRPASGSGCCGRFHDAEEREVVGLGAARGEDDLGRPALEQGGALIAGVLDGGAGALTGLVDGAGVGEDLGPERRHGLDDLGEKRGGGVRVHVERRHTSSLEVER